jgi:hypothetical protein
MSMLDRLYESLTDVDLCDFWNEGAEIDDLGELEEELMSRGYPTRRKNCRRNRRLRAGDPDDWQRFFSEGSHII